MAYSESLRQAIYKAPDNEGSTLGRAAVAIDFSAARISKATGATRQTVYNWLIGGPVATFYKDKVQALTLVLKDAKSAEQAWKRICETTSLRT
jgi:hypothetical protein